MAVGLIDTKHVWKPGEETEDYGLYKQIERGRGDRYYLLLHKGDFWNGCNQLRRVDNKG